MAGGKVWDEELKNFALGANLFATEIRILRKVGTAWASTNSPIYFRDTVI